MLPSEMKHPAMKYAALSIIIHVVNFTASILSALLLFITMKYAAYVKAEIIEQVSPRAVLPPGTRRPSPEAIRYTPMIARITASMFNLDLFSPKKSIMQAVTTTGYMKLIVDAIPLEMFAYPYSSVMEVTALSMLRIIIFQASSRDDMRSVLFL